MVRIADLIGVSHLDGRAARSIRLPNFLALSFQVSGIGGRDAASSRIARMVYFRMLRRCQRSICSRENGVPELLRTRSGEIVSNDWQYIGELLHESIVSGNEFGLT